MLKTSVHTLGEGFGVLCDQSYEFHRMKNPVKNKTPQMHIEGPDPYLEIRRSQRFEVAGLFSHQTNKKSPSNIPEYLGNRIATPWQCARRNNGADLLNRAIFICAW